MQLYNIKHKKYTLYIILYSTFSYLIFISQDYFNISMVLAYEIQNKSKVHQCIYITTSF